MNTDRIDTDARQTVEEEMQSLRDELEHYRHEKEQIRAVIGQIGGAKAENRDAIITRTFIIAIIIVFIVDILRHLLGIKIPLPPLFSLEISILLVSLKIIWMMHKQAKVEHFQFWILHSIEFRLNALSKQLRNLETRPRKDTSV